MSMPHLNLHSVGHRPVSSAVCDWFAVVLAALVVLLFLSTAAGAEPAAAPPGGGEGQTITLAVGRSTVVKTPWPQTRVSVTDPKIADIRGLAADQVLVLGRTVGTTDLMIWSQNEELLQRRINVVADIGPLKEDLSRLLPGSALELHQSQNTVVVTGTVARAQQVEQMHKFLDASKLQYVDMTSVPGVQQVQLQVRVAEVSRAAIRVLGFNMFQTGKDMFSGMVVGPANGGPLNPISIGVPAGASGTATPPFQFTGTAGVSSAVTLFAGFPQLNLEVFIQALAENQYLRLLAEPTLVALSGEQASFLAGGEFPIPIAQSGTGGGGSTITIEYKEFGVRLKFRPVVLGDNTIRLFVSPEVSELTEVGAVVIQGFRVPALITRRAETTLELKSGQSFGMAGLINRTVNARNSRIPGLGDVPVLGALFRSARYESGDTELVVMVKASLVEPTSYASQTPVPGAAHEAPNDWELYAMGQIEGQPSKLSAPMSDWLKDTGLSRLRGPGGWVSYDSQPPRANTLDRSFAAPAASAPAE